MEQTSCVGIEQLQSLYVSLGSKSLLDFPWPKLWLWILTTASRPALRDSCQAEHPSLRVVHGPQAGLSENYLMSLLKSQQDWIGRTTERSISVPASSSRLLQEPHKLTLKGLEAYKTCL